MHTCMYRRDTSKARSIADQSYGKERRQTDLELNVDLIAATRQRQPAPEPAHLRLTILGESDVLVGVDDGIGSKVPPTV